MKGGRTRACMDCGMYDPYDGGGDGIGSCDCPRCENCGAAPGMCECEEWIDADNGRCDDPYCCASPDRDVTTVDTGGLT